MISDELMTDEEIADLFARLVESGDAAATFMEWRRTCKGKGPELASDDTHPPTRFGFIRLLDDMKRDMKATPEGRRAGDDTIDEMFDTLVDLVRIGGAHEFLASSEAAEGQIGDARGKQAWFFFDEEFPSRPISDDMVANVRLPCSLGLSSAEDDQARLEMVLSTGRQPEPREPDVKTFLALTYGRHTIAPVRRPRMADALFDKLHLWEAGGRSKPLVWCGGRARSECVAARPRLRDADPPIAALTY